jgi:hypothetical protein
VRRVHHDGANDAHAVGAISCNSLFWHGFAPWHGCCNASPFAIDSRNQELSRAMKTNKTIGIGL